MPDLEAVRGGPHGNGLPLLQGYTLEAHRAWLLSSDWYHHLITGCCCCCWGCCCGCRRRCCIILTLSVQGWVFLCGTCVCQQRRLRSGSGLTGLPDLAVHGPQVPAYPWYGYCNVGGALSYSVCMQHTSKQGALTRKHTRCYLGVDGCTLWGVPWMTTRMYGPLGGTYLRRWDNMAFVEAVG
jgi:hypothetical protein